MRRTSFGIPHVRASDWGLVDTNPALLARAPDGLARNRARGVPIDSVVVTMPATMQTTVPTPYWHALDDGRVQCDLCPRDCKLRDGQRGLCFVRAREGGEIVLTTYGRSSGFCIDPIEKKPLNHFLPGHAVLSFGTAGCNLACKFCQNWDISKSREIDTLADAASPEAIARPRSALGCRSVAFTYNDPVDLHGVRDRRRATRAATRGVADRRRHGRLHLRRSRAASSIAHMDAANVDLKAFTEDFYHKVCGGDLATVLDTLEYLVHETDVWFEITTLLIPGQNDSDDELDAHVALDRRDLGPDVPLHFTAFHPDFKMIDVPPTPPATLTRARRSRSRTGCATCTPATCTTREGQHVLPGCGAR